MNHFFIKACPKRGPQCAVTDYLLPIIWSHTDNKWSFFRQCVTACVNSNWLEIQFFFHNRGQSIWRCGFPDHLSDTIWCHTDCNNLSFHSDTFGGQAFSTHLKWYLCSKFMMSESVLREHIEYHNDTFREKPFHKIVHMVLNIFFGCVYLCN